MSPVEEMPAKEKHPLTAGESSPNDLYDKCMYLSRNLWWSWHPEVISLFRDLDPIRWRQLDHNPIALLPGDLLVMEKCNGTAFAIKGIQRSELVFVQIMAV